MLKYFTLILAILVTGCASTSNLSNLTKSDKQIEISGGQMPSQGWQPGFSNCLQLFLTNPLDQKVDFYNAEYCFYLKGQKTKFSGTFAGYNPIAANSRTAQEYCPVFFPAELAESGTNLSLSLTCYAKNDQTLITGTKLLPIKISRITSKFKVVKGKHIALELTEESFAGIDKVDQIVDIVDKSYLQMADLIGKEPNDGQMMALRESPARGFYARAGYPILLNDGNARKDFQAFNRGALSYVWLHEMGHNFEYGHWYMYNSPACEFHANFKLVYAVETLFDGTNDVFKLYHWGKAKEGNPTFATGKEWVDSHFLKSGDKYLADQSRAWKSLSSNELMAFNLGLVRKYGWEPYKKLYRTYDHMNKIGTPKPDINTPEEKMGLQLSILSMYIDEPIIDYCQKWRIPMTQAKVDGFLKKYNLKKTI